MGEKEGLEKGEKNTVPWDKLTDELKNKLKEIYNKLPKEVREELEKKAKENLEDLEDELIKESRGKLSEDENPPTHAELDKIKAEHESEKAKEEKIEKDRKKAEAERKKIERELDNKITGDLAEYDKLYREVAPLVDELYNRVHQIFLPQRHPRWLKGFQTGHRLDLAKVMQFQADRSLYDKIWERKTIPQKIDYRFTLLVDLSGSMQGEKIELTFRGSIVLAEVLNRLSIKSQILGFQDEVIMYKDFDDQLSPQIRQDMAVMRREVSNKGNHNQSGYNSDGYCLKKASEMLSRQKGKDNFLIVLSDGYPVPDEAHAGPEYDLQEIIDAIRKKTKQKLIGVGLGPDTEHVADYYPISLPSTPLKDMPRVLGDLLEDMIKFPDSYR
ncbi:MAG: cobaltochelatase CobT-related protein [Patescibacteria group bacterium]